MGLKSFLKKFSYVVLSEPSIWARWLLYYNTTILILGSFGIILFWHYQCCYGYTWTYVPLL